MEEVWKFIKECGVYFLGTMDGDQPRVRPFGTCEIFENHLYIQTGKIKKVSHQIEKNPKVELCCFKDGKWLRLSGKLKRDDRRAAKKDMLDKNPELKSMYSCDDDNTEVLYFEHGKAVFSSFVEEDRILEF